MKSAFAVCSGSSGDSHAIVTQLAKMVVRMIGSNNLDSMASMHRRRGCAAGRKQQNARLRYTISEGPRISGLSRSKPSRPGKVLSRTNTDGVVATFGEATLASGAFTLGVCTVRGVGEARDFPNFFRSDGADVPAVRDEAGGIWLPLALSQNI